MFDLVELVALRRVAPRPAAQFCHARKTLSVARAFPDRPLLRGRVVAARQLLPGGTRRAATSSAASSGAICHARKTLSVARAFPDRPLLRGRVVAARQLLPGGTRRAATSS